MNDHICKAHRVNMYRKYNSTLWVCPLCLIEKNKALLVQAVTKKNNEPKNTLKRVNRKTPRQRAMDRADTWFSRYIRLKYSFVSGSDLYCKCYTCGRIHHIKTIECGHWQRRGYKTTRFNENNARPQCTHCNKFRSGVPEKFEINLIREIGQDEVSGLKELSQQTGEDNELFYREQSKKLRNLFNGLLKEKGIKNPWNNARQLTNIYYQ